jgi:hypothetical protein
MFVCVGEAREHARRLRCWQCSRITICSLFCFEAGQSFSPSTIDRHIELSKTYDRFINKGPHIVFIADVSANNHRLRSKRLQLRNQLFVVVYLDGRTQQHVPLLVQRSPR